MPPSSPVVVIGLDTMDARLALELARGGRLPTLSALLDSGAWAPTVTPPGLVVGGIWPSITTGCWPSRHGFYADRQLSTGTYEARKAGPWEITQPRLWEVASAAGLRCAVLDAPLTTQLPELNGIQLVEWGAHDRFVPTASYPPEFVDEVNERVGAYPVQPKCDAYTDDLPALRAALLAGADARCRLASEVLTQEPWPFGRRGGVPRGGGDPDRGQLA